MGDSENFEPQELVAIGCGGDAVFFLESAA